MILDYEHLPGVVCCFGEGVWQQSIYIYSVTQENCHPKGSHLSCDTLIYWKNLLLSTGTMDLSWHSQPKSVICLNTLGQLLCSFMNNECQYWTSQLLIFSTQYDVVSCPQTKHNHRNTDTKLKATTHIYPLTSHIRVQDCLCVLHMVLYTLCINSIWKWFICTDNRRLSVIASNFLTTGLDINFDFISDYK